MIDIKIDNMEEEKDDNESSDLFEFSLPKSEVNADLAVGEFGSILVPVEVLSVTSDSIIFRRHGPAQADGAFKSESLEQMRERMGTVDDEEKIMTKKDKKDEDGE